MNGLNIAAKSSIMPYIREEVPPRSSDDNSLYFIDISESEIQMKENL